MRQVLGIFLGMLVLAAGVLGAEVSLTVRGLEEGGGVRGSDRSPRTVLGVELDEQWMYQELVLGEMELRFEGLPDERLRIELGNAEFHAHSQYNRAMDVWLNGELVVSPYVIFDRVGFRRGDILELEGIAQEGVLRLALKRHLPQADAPQWAWVRVSSLDSDFEFFRTAAAVERRPRTVEHFLRWLPEEAVGQTEPPIRAQYKIHPSETDRLTEADVVGPDGIVYPNWLDVGIDGGIPAVPVVLHVRDFGAVPGNGQDDSAAIQAALDAAAAQGGGAVLLESGVYTLKEPLFIFHDDVVLRGAGARKTTLSFEFAPPHRGMRVLTVAADPDGALGPDSQLQAWFDFAELESIRWSIGGHELLRREAMRRETYMHYLSTYGAALLDVVGPGQHELEIVAVYRDVGEVRELRELDLRAGEGPENPFILHHLGAVNILGKGFRGARYPLAEDARRGDRKMVLESEPGWSIGDRIAVHAPATERWNAEVRNSAPWGDYRRNLYRLESLAEQCIGIPYPLRIDFPAIDGAYVQAFEAVQRSGVESLRIVQPKKLWTSGIFIANAWECWIADVRVERAGRHPFYTNFVKKLEVRDSVFDNVWFKQGGGSGYGGFERAYDCLMDNVVTRHLRHAPLLQWSAAGNVIRRSHFYDSDGQWHAGWTHENLLEDISIQSGWDNGSYGYGLYSSSPEAGLHGPTGPRNVVYNSDISAPSIGLWMGGMNENFIIAYNRFVNGWGPAIYAKHASFNHIIRGNLFVSLDPDPAVLYFAGMKSVKLRRIKFCF